MPMKMKRLLFLSFLLLVISAQNVSAIPAGLKTLMWSEDRTFLNFDDSPIAQVDCDVWRYDPGPYLYTYQITNISETHLSFFMMEILDAAGIQSTDYDLEGDWVEPDVWAVNASGQSVNALFNTNSLDMGEMSALLWYLSDYEPICSRYFSQEQPVAPWLQAHTHHLSCYTILTESLYQPPPVLSQSCSA